MENKFNPETKTTDKNPNDRPYYNIPYLTARLMSNFNTDDYVYIEEKIDGANVSLRIEPNGTVRTFGRRLEMDDTYSIGGSRNWLLGIADRIKENYGSKYIFYFEYLIQHSVVYDPKYYEQGFLISVVDAETGNYLPENQVREIGQKLDIMLPALFYEGPFRDWAFVSSFVGKSELGAKTGEGVIIKSSTKDGTQKMIKVVSEEFAESKHYDIKSRQNKIAKKENTLRQVKEIVTEARVIKALYRMVEDGLVSSLEQFTEEEQNLMLGKIGKYVYADCVKEEPEFVKNFGKEFGGACANVSKEYAERYLQRKK